MGEYGWDEEDAKGAEPEWDDAVIRAAELGWAEEAARIEKLARQQRNRRKRQLQAIGAVEFVLLSFWGWITSAPSGQGSLSLAEPLVWLVWIGLAVGWVALVLAALFARWGDRPQPRISIRAWLVVPLGVALFIAAVATQAPLRVRLELSRNALEQAASDVIAGRRPPASIHHAGLFDLERVDRAGGSVRFLVKDTGFLDPGGLVWSPGGRPPAMGEDSYWHLTDHWWRWEESW